jgi:hypothetical protein
MDTQGRSFPQFDVKSPADADGGGGGGPEFEELYHGFQNSFYSESSGRKKMEPNRNGEGIGYTEDILIQAYKRTGFSEF